MINAYLGVNKIMGRRISRTTIIEGILIFVYRTLVRIRLFKNKVLIRCEYPQMSTITPAKVSDPIMVSGWAISRKGIREVNVYIDDVFFGSASYGMPRPDIHRLFNNIPDSHLSGFTKMIFLENEMKKGIHRLKLVAEDNTSLSYSIEGIFKFENGVEVTPISALRYHNRKIEIE